MNMKAMRLTTLIGLCFILVALLFLKGKGASLFHGPRGVIEPRFNPKTLCKLTGICFLVSGVTIIVMGLTLSFCSNFVFYIYAGIIFSCMILMSILFKINKYFG